ncbi:hypothetical protein TIFTF001_038805 [Ficus carica]|uniref:Uncharacterized protein n=1 Tax=Ficus carica TaxID=3494 RepID=A0AA88EB65_FICCA|nr:hypothetical protein TIFTF001_038805 [Ficus carica]
MRLKRRQGLVWDGEWRWFNAGGEVDAVAGSWFGVAEHDFATKTVDHSVESVLAVR